MVAVVAVRMVSIVADYRLLRPYIRAEITTMSRTITTGTTRIFQGLSNRSPNIMP
jgi:hypothetical protein